MSKDVTPWKKEYELGFKSLDIQHKSLLDCINSLSLAINEGRSNEIMTEILSQLNKYASDHFQYEEIHFKKFNYLGTDDHLREHGEFRDCIRKFSKDFANKRIADRVDREVITYLINWWLSHTQESDRKFIECFKTNGLK